MQPPNKPLQAKGIVQQCSDHEVVIRLDEPSGCQVCSKGLCFSKGEQRSVQVRIKNQAYQVGDVVNVHVSTRTGSFAVLMFYGLPFLLMMVTLVVLLIADMEEGVAGLSAMLILVPYFSLLRLNRKWLSRQCKLEVTML
jgi:sigma-E factor negative regulatory protein RseC